MKTFASHPVMLEDANLDHVTGGGDIGGGNNSNVVNVINSGNDNSFNNSFNDNEDNEDSFNFGW